MIHVLTFLSYKSRLHVSRPHPLSQSSCVTLVGVAYHLPGCALRWPESKKYISFSGAALKHDFKSEGTVQEKV